MTCQIAIVPEAEQQLWEIDRWCLTHRGAAPDLFLDEFKKSLDLLSELPDIGSRFNRTNRPNVRRLLLQHSKYWIYYFHDRQRSIGYMLTIWSTFRGSDPHLPEL